MAKTGSVPSLTGLPWLGPEKHFRVEKSMAEICPKRICVNSFMRVSSCLNNKICARMKSLSPQKKQPLTKNNLGA
jgi:hypothetical protein